jgi:hypothetical protein
MNSSKKFENLLSVESMQKILINKRLKVISMSVKKRGKKTKFIKIWDQK